MYYFLTNKISNCTNISNIAVIITILTRLGILKGDEQLKLNDKFNISVHDNQELNEVSYKSVGKLHSCVPLINKNTFIEMCYDFL